jgi:putative oxidoreductase
MSELKFLSEVEPRNVVGDWAIRVVVGCAFVVFGWEKFSSQPGSQWVKMFHDIGAGDWFRYFTGVMEVLGGLLVMIPRTALIGFGMLVVTMMGAVLIVALVLGSPVQSLFPAIFLMALIGAALWHHGNR